MIGTIRHSPLVVAIGFGFIGCSAPVAPPPEPPRFEIEIETVEQQARQAVAAAPLEFTVPLRESDEAWARAVIFFSQYTSAAGRVREAGSRVLVISTESDSADPYRYSVRREITPNGYLFSVICVPNGDSATPELAERNGRNLARFIGEGTLEVSLLVG